MDMSGLEIVEIWGRPEVVHKREINENSTWADRVINGVFLDDTCYWDDEIKNISFLRQFSAQEEDQEPIIVNGRDFDSDISVSESGHSHDEKGEGKFYRKRKVNKPTKNFPTKPKTKIVKKDKVTDQEQYEEWRSTEAYMPMYDDSPFQYQPYEVRVHYTVKGKYKGPGHLVNDQSFFGNLFNKGWYFPPVRWVHPKIDYLEIFLQIDYIETGKWRAFDILTGENARYVSDVWVACEGFGIKFYDYEDPERIPPKYSL